MSFRNNNPNTRSKIAKFSVDEWIEFRERLEQLVKNDMLSARDEEILRELIYKNKTTEQLAYLARNDENYSWLQSNQGKPMSARRIMQILTEYFPEFHIQKTHKKDNKNQKIRTEQATLKKVMISDDSCCSKCGCKENLELHHMFPVSLGGDNNDCNLLVLCHECHQKITLYNREIIRRNRMAYAD